MSKFGELHPELRIFLNFSWVIVICHFVGCSNVYLKIIVKYEIDHHIRDPMTRDLDFPIFLLIDFDSDMSTFGFVVVSSFSFKCSN